MGRARPLYTTIMWYTPPYNAAAKTNLGKQFLQLIDRHFPKGHKLHKIINRNTVKISYSCTKKYQINHFGPQHQSPLEKQYSSKNMQLQEPHNMPSPRQLPERMCRLQSNCHIKQRNTHLCRQHGGSF